MLVEMSFTVIMTEGTKPAIVAPMNMTRIDFLRPQIAHVLKAKISSEERMVRTRRQLLKLLIITEDLGATKTSIAVSRAGLSEIMTKVGRGRHHGEATGAHFFEDR